MDTALFVLKIPLFKILHGYKQFSVCDLEQEELFANGNSLPFYHAQNLPVTFLNCGRDIVRCLDKLKLQSGKLMARKHLRRHEVDRKGILTYSSMF